MSEEKIKNDEMMSDEELENVAGGITLSSQMADDSRFLNSLDGSTDRYGAIKGFFNGREIWRELEGSWSRFGITLDATSSGDLLYYLGKAKVQITREQARQHAMKITGHYITEKDWKW